jgi:hypothetical protein
MGAPVEDGVVEALVVVGHAVHGEPLDGMAPALVAVEAVDGVDGSGEVFGGGGEVASGVVIDKLGGGTTGRGDDRGAAGEGFDHDQAERLTTLV